MKWSQRSVNFIFPTVSLGIDRTGILARIIGTIGGVDLHVAPVPVAVSTAVR